MNRRENQKGNVNPMMRAWIKKEYGPKWWEKPLFYTLATVIIITRVSFLLIPIAVLVFLVFMIAQML